MSPSVKITEKGIVIEEKKKEKVSNAPVTKEKKVEKKVEKKIAVKEEKTKEVQE